MGHLPKGGVREAPTSERSFLAGETERVLEPPIGKLEMSSITVLRMLTSSDHDLIFLSFSVIIHASLHPNFGYVLGSQT